MSDNKKPKPKMELVGQDGNVFSVLGRANNLLKENRQKMDAQEMCMRVMSSGSYEDALNIISEYVETELSEKTPEVSDKAPQEPDKTNAPSNKAKKPPVKSGDAR